MKFYETHFEEYIGAMEKYNLHPEINQVFAHFPHSIRDFENLIVYGPSGSGKYSQVLRLLRRYCAHEMKYEKITVQTEKQNYTFHISDIHYEVDMSFLGCNSKLIWHEVFFQIVDIVSVKQEKVGIIVCKNFHMIHSELLEIFYRYMQQYSNAYMGILIKFVILTEHVSFLPMNIIDSCEVLPIRKPSAEQYVEMVQTCRGKDGALIPAFTHKINEMRVYNQASKTVQVLENLDTTTVLNIKELRSFPLVRTAANGRLAVEQIPVDIFNIVCDQIIEKMTELREPSDRTSSGSSSGGTDVGDVCNESNMNFAQFRDAIYDILIYNLDVTECIWYILTHFIQTGDLNDSDVDQVLQKTYSFLKYYNNNYRPIYHLESILFYFIIKIHKYECTECAPSSRTLKCGEPKRQRNKKTVSAASAEIPSR